MTTTTCPSSGIQSHKYITIPCEMLKRHSENQVHRMCNMGDVIHYMSFNVIQMYRNVIYWDVSRVSFWTYCEDGEGPSRAFAQQHVELVLRESVHDETEDEEDRQENALSAAHQRVKTDAFVVSDISPECTRRTSDYISHFLQQIILLGDSSPWRRYIW